METFNPDDIYEITIDGKKWRCTFEFWHGWEPAPPTPSRSMEVRARALDDVEDL